MCVLIFWQPNNILLMTEHAYPEIKIIDFGLARQIKDGEQICLIVGTPEYVGKCCICIFITHYTSIINKLYLRFMLFAPLCFAMYCIAQKKYRSEFYFADRCFCILQGLIFMMRKTKLIFFELGINFCNFQNLAFIKNMFDIFFFFFHSNQSLAATPVGYHEQFHCFI